MLLKIWDQYDTAFDFEDQCDERGDQYDTAFNFEDQCDERGGKKKKTQDGWESSAPMERLCDILVFFISVFVYLYFCIFVFVYICATHTPGRRRQAAKAARKGFEAILSLAMNLKYPML